MPGIFESSKYTKHYRLQKEFAKLTRRQQKRIIYKSQAHR